LPSDLVSQIAEAVATLSPSERRVAELVLRQPATWISATTAELARHAGVSEPTVIRFCRTVGCAGVQDFKLRLAQDLAATARHLPVEVAADDTVGMVAAKVLNREIAELTRVRNSLDAVTLEAATVLLAGASRLEFYGFGASGSVAHDAQNKFFRLGLPVVAHTDFRVQAMSASILGPGAVVVAISHTGRTRELLQSVDIALRNNVPVVAVTASGTPLSQRATVCVPVDVVEDTSLYTPMSSRLAHLAMLDVLQVTVALRRGDAALAAMTRSKLAVRG
jgi:RpiR family transcriptional regulator, carbohydrate utilization regulator